MVTNRQVAYGAGPRHTKGFLDHTNRFKIGHNTPREYLEEYLEKIELLEDQVRAFVSIDLEAARKAADAAGRRYQEDRPNSRLDGLPIALKDIIQTADLPTESGSPIFKGWTALQDSPVAAALKRAGTIIVGKTATTEFAYGATTETRNPYDLQRTPGTSSSGSAAAVGAGMLPVSIGSQLMSSVMRPASYCGHVGVKPTYGVIRQDAIHPFSPSGEHVGIHAHALADAWMLLKILSAETGPIPGWHGIQGPDQLPSPKKPVKLLRMYTPGWELAAPGICSAFEQALDHLENAGIEIVEPIVAQNFMAIEEDFSRADWCIAEVAAFEMRWPFFEYESQGHSFHPRISNLLNRAHKITSDEYHYALKWKDEFRARFMALSDLIDGVIGLTAPEVANIGLENIGHPVMCSPASCIGAPAITLPALQVDGLPLGLQIVGFPGKDADMFSHAVWVDDALAR